MGLVRTKPKWPCLGEGEKGLRLQQIMREDHDIIKGKFSAFIDTWKTGRTDILAGLVREDVHAYLSVVGSSEEGEQHSLLGIKAFVEAIPKSDSVDYDICQYVCRINGCRAHQSAEVPYLASNDDGSYFLCVATFCNAWVKEGGAWLMEEIRMDVKDYDSPLSDYFKKAWYFESNEAVLTATVHLPCIFPDIDNPYYRVPSCEDVLTEEEKVEEAFFKLIYGVDWIVFTFCRDTLSEEFVSPRGQDRKAWIAETKWARQRFRYWCHPYKVERVQIKGDLATADVSSMLADCLIRQVSFAREDGVWRVLSFTEGA